MKTRASRRRERLKSLAITFPRWKSEGEAGLKIRLVPLFPALRQQYPQHRAGGASQGPASLTLPLDLGATRGFSPQLRPAEHPVALGQSKGDTLEAPGLPGHGASRQMLSLFSPPGSLWFLCGRLTRAQRGWGTAWPFQHPTLSWPFSSCLWVFGEPGQAPSAFSPCESCLQPPGTNPFRRYPHSSCCEPSRRNLHRSRSRRSFIFGTVDSDGERGS